MKKIEIVLKQREMQGGKRNFNNMTHMEIPYIIINKIMSILEVRNTYYMILTKELLDQQKINHIAI